MGLRRGWGGREPGSASTEGPPGRGVPEGVKVSRGLCPVKVGRGGELAVADAGKRGQGVRRRRRRQGDSGEDPERRAGAGGRRRTRAGGRARGRRRGEGAGNGVEEMWREHPGKGAGWGAGLSGGGGGCGPERGQAGRDERSRGCGSVRERRWTGLPPLPKSLSGLLHSASGGGASGVGGTWKVVRAKSRIQDELSRGSAGGGGARSGAARQAPNWTPRWPCCAREMVKGGPRAGAGVLPSWARPSGKVRRKSPRHPPVSRLFGPRRRQYQDTGLSATFCLSSLCPLLDPRPRVPLPEGSFLETRRCSSGPSRLRRPGRRGVGLALGLGRGGWSPLPRGT